VRKLPWEARLDDHALRIVMALLREPQIRRMWKTLRAKPELSFRGCLQFQSGEDVTRLYFSDRSQVYYELVAAIDMH